MIMDSSSAKRDLLKVLGVLALARNAGESFNPEETALVSSIANPLGVALHSVGGPLFILLAQLGDQRFKFFLLSRVFLVLKRELEVGDRFGYVA